MSTRDGMMPARVLELIWSFEVGGSERLAGQLAEAFDKARHPVIVCATHRGHDVLSERLQARGIECIALNSERRGRLGRLWLPFQLWWLIVRRRIAVVHVHHFFLLPVCYRAVKLAGARLVATEHTDFDMKRSLANRRTVGRYCRKTKRLSVIHAGIRDFMVGQLRVPADQVKVILNGVDTEEFFPAESAQQKARLRTTLGLPEKGVLFGWVGRMHPDKDLPTLLAAFGKVKSDGAHLLLVGDGEERPRVEALVSEQEMENITLLGMRSDIPELLRCMDVFVLSSATEGMPLVILEALSTGLPIVSTNVGGIAESLNDASSMLVSPGRPLDLALLLQRVADDAQMRDEMGAAARELAISQYDLSKTTEQYRELLFGPG